MAKAKKKTASKQKQQTKKSTPARVTQALSPIEQMERRFEDFFSRGWLHPFQWDFPAWAEKMPHLSLKVPKVDIIDRNKEVLVRAEIPGVEKKDLEISATSNSITIKGSTRHEEKEEKGDYFRSEITQGSFSRTVTLPAEVNSEKAKTRFKNGVLELTLPKVAKSERRTIPVK